MVKHVEDSGIGWIREAREYFTIIKLKYLTQVKRGASPRPIEKFITDDDEGYNWIRIGDSVPGEKYITSTKLKINKEGARSSVEVKPGDLIMSNSMSIGRAYIVGVPGYIHDGWLAFSFDEERVNGEWLSYALNASVSYLERMALGTTVFNLNIERVKSLEIPYCDIRTQRKITNFLDQKTAHIDSIINDTKKSIEEFKNYKKAVISEAVTKGLNSKAVMKDSGIEWIGDVPESWSVLNFKSVMYKKKEICQNYDGQNILSLTLNGVIVRDLINPKGKMPTSFDGYQRIEKGNLLLCLFDIDVTPRCVGYAWDDGLTSPAYSQYVMRSNAFARYYEYLLLFLDDQKILLHLTKSLRNTLNDADFGVIKTIQPSYEEQKEIVEYLDQKCAHIENLIQQKQQLITELETYKKSLIYEYVTGKKEVL